MLRLAGNGGISIHAFISSIQQGYKQKLAYIATQAPLKETIEDFWSMVWQQGAGCVVMLAKTTEKSQVRSNTLMWQYERYSNLSS